MSRGFFFRIPNEVVESGLLKTIRHVDLKVYMAIGSHANWKTGISRPGWKLICQEAGVCKTSFFKSIPRLESFGLMETMRHIKSGRGNAYRIFRNPQILPDMIPITKESAFKRLKRDKSGKPIPTKWEKPVPTQKEFGVPTQKEPNYILNDISMNKKEASPYTISEITLKENLKVMGPEKLREYMIAHGHDPAKLQKLIEAKVELPGDTPLQSIPEEKGKAHV